MTTVPGYRVSIELFLPADPEQPRQMAQSAAQLDSLAEQLDRIGLPGATVSFRFVSRHRLPPSPPAPAPDPQGEPPQPLDHAPAGPAAAGAADTSGPSGEAGKADGQPAAVPFNVSLPEAPGLACRHPFGKEHPARGRVCAVCEAPMPAEVAA